MIVRVEYENSDNKFSIPISYLAVELDIPLEELLKAVERTVERY